MPTSVHSLIFRALVTLYLPLSLTSLGAAAETSPAYQFSADIVSRDAAGVAVGVTGRLYAANRQVRIEMSGAQPEFFLIDGDAGRALLVRPTQHLFMDAKQSTSLTQLFVPIDPTDPCPQWQAAAKNAGAASIDSDWRCTRIRGETVDGGGTIEYRVVSADQKVSRRWIDTRLEFPVKWQTADGTTFSLEHIRMEEQPATLFALPPSYRKFDPQALIERIKHSDVWADPPH
jgi:hypothetical protein